MLSSFLSSVAAETPSSRDNVASKESLPASSNGKITPDVGDAGLDNGLVVVAAVEELDDVACVCRGAGDGCRGVSSSSKRTLLAISGV